MKHKILFVDDDANMLGSTKRLFDKQFDVTTALSGEEGLLCITEHGPFAVVISDLVMEGMDGFHFLSQVNKASPASACIMLTGHANLQASLRAVNEGGIFRFLTKPCKNHIFFNAISEGVRHYQRNAQSLVTPQRPAEIRELKRILIVDDDPELLSLLAGAFRSCSGVEVLTADHGGNAVRVLNTIKIDMVITDLDMPVMNGMELLEHINHGHAGMPVILFSWCITEETEQKAKLLGAVRCFEKPPDLEALPETVQEVLYTGPRGIIDGISTTAFLQMIEMEEKTCTLTVRAPDKIGVMYLYKGRLLDAVTGTQKHEAAAFEIINWESAEIEIDNACRKKEAHIANPLMQILMEAARLKDDIPECL